MSTYYWDPPELPPPGTPRVSKVVQLISRNRPRQGRRHHDSCGSGVLGGARLHGGAGAPGGAETMGAATAVRSAKCMAGAGPLAAAALRHAAGEAPGLLNPLGAVAGLRRAPLVRPEDHRRRDPTRRGLPAVRHRFGGDNGIGGSLGSGLGSPLRCADNLCLASVKRSSISIEQRLDGVAKRRAPRGMLAPLDQPLLCSMLACQSI